MTSYKGLISKVSTKLAFLPLFLLVVGIGFTSSAQAGGGGEFKPGEMIMEHIGDAHDWHLWDVTGDDGEKQGVSVPLPVIVYHPDRGTAFFMSSEFHHGHDPAHGYRVWTREYAEKVGEKASKHKINSLVAVTEADQYDEAATGGIIDLSITKNVAAMLFSIVVLLWIMFAVAKGYKRNAGKAPRGLQSLLEPIIIFVRDDIAKASIGHKYEKFMPFLLTVFFFIWINNILGLIPIMPGGANVTGNIAIPLVLATFVLIITLMNGNGHYWRHIVAMPGVPVGVLPIVTALEIAGIFIKPIVLMIRLFANITAGHISMLVFFSLIFIAGAAGAGMGYGVAVPAVLFTIFLNFLELLVGFVQAYVFTLLAAIYFGMAVEEAHH